MAVSNHLSGYGHCGDADMYTSSARCCTPTSPWLGRPNRGLCFLLCQNQLRPELHLLVAVSLIGRRENCSICKSRVTCITHIYERCRERYNSLSQ